MIGKKLNFETTDSVSINFLREKMAGAPIGNKNACKGKVWADALHRAIAQDQGKRVRLAAEKLLDEASRGQQWAIRELADRLDGRPRQEASVDAELASGNSGFIVRWAKE